jgi:hypothetical protein
MYCGDLRISGSTATIDSRSRPTIPTDDPDRRSGGLDPATPTAIPDPEFFPVPESQGLTVRLRHAGADRHTINV